MKGLSATHKRLWNGCCQGIGRHRISCGYASRMGEGCEAHTARYVEDTLEHNRTFDATAIVARDPSREGRLKYWNNELCAKHPLTFDFVVTVHFPQPAFSHPANTMKAWRRWNTALCKLVVPENCPSRPLIRSRLPRLSH